MSTPERPPPGAAGGAEITGGARLTPEEQKLVAKLLSDPTYFPIEFRTWLKQFFEAGDIRITQGQIVGGGGTNVATGLPAGIILAVAASTAIPVDSLLCDGSAVVRADQLALFNAIGVTWGAGDGTTTFNIPDLRDRSLYGQGSRISVAATDGVASGSRGGPDHQHSIATQTTSAAGAHSHGGSVGGGGHEHNYDGHGNVSIQQGTAGSYATVADYIQYGKSTTGGGGHSHSIPSDGSHTHTFSGGTSGGFALNHGSYAGVIYVITTG